MRTLARFFLDGGPAETPLAKRDDRIIRYAQFRAEVAGNARALRQAGCRRGLLLTDDSYAAAVGLLALLHAGAEIIMPQNTQPGTLESLRGSFDFLVSDKAQAGAAQVILRQGGGDEALPAEPLPADAPLTFFTSGSTGQPKRVDKILQQLDSEAVAVEAVLGALVPRHGEVHATVTHQHVYGLAFRLCWPLLSGRVFASVTHEIWETALMALRADCALISSPAHLGRLGGIAPVGHAVRPSLILSAGAPLPSDAVAATAAIFGVAPTEIFGSTETGAVAVRRHWLNEQAWQPLPGVTIGQQEDGAMAVQAVHVAPNGRYIGADMVDLLPDGRFHFRGRSDGVVKIEGKRVSLPEVEDHLRRLAWIEDAAAVVLDDPVIRFGAVVVPSAAGAARLAELGPFRFSRLLCRELTATQIPAGLPRRWRFVTQMPAGALGKRRQADLRALFGERRVAPVLRPAIEPNIRRTRTLADGVEIDFVLPASQPQLEGHFPGRPILPGVVQIDWAVRLAARYLDLPVVAAQNFQVKFRAVIEPGLSVTLTLRHVAARRRLSFEYRAADQVLSSGQIALEPA